MAPILGAALLALAPGFASAALEGAPSTAPAAKVQRAAAVTAAGVTYTDITRTLHSGTVVHEFVDADGQVFAVTWSGPFKPDLKHLLGRHFDRLQDGGGTRNADRAHVDVKDSDLVVQSGGHMGAFEGKAWVPTRLPAGFDTQEMK